MSAMIDRTESLGEVVRRMPAAADVFERLGFDYCCGGDRSLDEAAAERGLDGATVAAMLDAVATAGEPAHRAPAGSPAELARHIVEAHHRPLREGLPRLGELVATVARVHGPEDPRMVEVERVFSALAADLLPHLDREEREVFPLAEAISSGGPAPRVDGAVIDLLESDHDDAGAHLARLRELCGGYPLDEAYCGTHRAMMHGLQELEVDMHRHVHEENNVLFPQLREYVGA
jgi:regulator of cell morphogenesis and NO signaling